MNKVEEYDSSSDISDVPTEDEFDDPEELLVVDSSEAENSDADSNTANILKQESSILESQIFCGNCKKLISSSILKFIDPNQNFQICDECYKIKVKEVKEGGLDSEPENNDNTTLLKRKTGPMVVIENSSQLGAKRELARLDSDFESFSNARPGRVGKRGTRGTRGRAVYFDKKKAENDNDLDLDLDFLSSGDSSDFVPSDLDQEQDTELEIGMESDFSPESESDNGIRSKKRTKGKAASSKEAGSSAKKQGVAQRNDKNLVNSRAKPAMKTERQVKNVAKTKAVTPNSRATLYKSSSSGLSASSSSSIKISTSLSKSAGLPRNSKAPLAQETNTVKAIGATKPKPLLKNYNGSTLEPTPSSSFLKQSPLKRPVLSKINSLAKPITGSSILSSALSTSNSTLSLSSTMVAGSKSPKISVGIPKKTVATTTAAATATISTGGNTSYIKPSIMAKQLSNSGFSSAKALSTAKAAPPTGIRRVGLSRRVGLASSKQLVHPFQSPAKKV